MHVRRRCIGLGECARWNPLPVRRNLGLYSQRRSLRSLIGSDISMDYGTRSRWWLVRERTHGSPGYVCAEGARAPPSHRSSSYPSSLSRFADLKWCTNPPATFFVDASIYRSKGITLPPLCLSSIFLSLLLPSSFFARVK